MINNEPKQRRSLIEGRLVNIDRITVAVTVIILLVVIAFSPWWAFGRAFAPLDILYELYEPWTAGDTEVKVHNHFTTDAVTQFLIYRVFAERSFVEDGFIGWNTLTHGGNPLYAQTMAGFDDWTTHLHRFFDFWSAWHLGFIARTLIAALGMLVFLRSQRLSPLVCLLGAVAFAFNSQFVLQVYYHAQLAGFAWVPWLLWAMYRYREGSLWAWALVPLFIGLAFLGGNLQTNGFVALVMIGLWIAWIMEIEPRSARSLALLTTHFAAWGVLGIGVAAFALYPNVLNYFDSLAAGNVKGVPGYGERRLYTAMLLIPLQAFPTLIGSPRSIDLMRLIHQTYFDIAYFGFLAVIISYRSILLKGIPRGAQVLILLGLLLPLTPLVATLYHRVQIIFIFGGVWAFAWYWQNASRQEVDTVLKWVFRLFIGLGILWVGLSFASVVLEEWIISIGQKAVASRMSQGEGKFAVFEGWMMQRPAKLIEELRIWHPRQLIPLAMVLVSFGALWLRVRIGLRSASMVLLGALTLELGAFAWGWVTFSDLEEYPFYAETRDIDAVREIVGDGRVYIIPHPRRPSLFPPNTLSAYGVATIQNYENISPLGMWQVIDQRSDARSLGSIGVTHAVGYFDQDLPGDSWALLYRGERVKLWRNKFVLPRYMAVASSQVNWIERFGSNPRDVLFSTIESGEIGIVSTTLNRRSLVVPPGTTVIRIAENWSEGWQFQVNDGPAHPVVRGVDMSMIVPLPDSRMPTQVELRYEPRRRELGYLFSLVSFAAIIIGSWLIARHRLIGFGRPH